jgi:atypical dual specificity phosphatase
MSFRRRLFAKMMFHPTLAWNYTLARVFHFRNWWDFVDPQVIVGARPFPRDVQKLFGLGVRAVVNTCEEYFGPVEEYKRLGIEQLHIPTTDFVHPELADVQRGVRFIQQHIERGNIVYVHCKAGRARSATIALCWLIQYKGLSPEEGQQQLLTARPHINPHLTRRPVVHSFIRSLEENPSPPPSDSP